MIINYVGTFRANICYDGDMTYTGMNNHYHPLQEYVKKAFYIMNQYGFTAAQIVDYDTGETLVEIIKEEA